MSREHLLHIGYYGNLRPARDVSLGDDVIVVTSGNVMNARVIEKENVIKWGAYCPHTTGTKASFSSKFDLDVASTKNESSDTILLGFSRLKCV